MKPVIMYIDDEPHNLTVFEAALSSDWEIHTFDSPLQALDKLQSINPWVVVSDQRMPGMTGVSFLEIVRRVCPHAIRALVTGYSDEDLVVDSVRKAQVYDYIRKPWDVEDLDLRVCKMVDTYKLEIELREKTEILAKQNLELVKLNEELRLSTEREKNYRKELESWAPPFILNAIFDKKVSFPTRRDLAVITFDLIESAKLHNVEINNIPVRNHILHSFSEIILKHGGWRESHSGDAAYAHFGMLKELERAADSALAAATEFRVYLRNFCNVHNLEIECGIGLHIAKNCLIDVHVISIHSSDGEIVQKSFDSISPDIDLVHRMEKFVHQLPGSNVIMSDVFLQSLVSIPAGVICVGSHLFKGQEKPVKLYIKTSDKISKVDIDLLVVNASDENDGISDYENASQLVDVKNKIA